MGEMRRFLVQASKISANTNTGIMDKIDQRIIDATANIYD